MKALSLGTADCSLPLIEAGIADGGTLSHHDSLELHLPLPEHREDYRPSQKSSLDGFSTSRSSTLEPATLTPSRKRGFDGIVEQACCNRASATLPEQCSAADYVVHSDNRSDSQSLRFEQAPLEGLHRHFDTANAPSGSQAPDELSIVRTYKPVPSSNRHGKQRAVGSPGPSPAMTVVAPHITDWIALPRPASRQSVQTFCLDDEQSLDGGDWESVDSEEQRLLFQPFQGPCLTEELWSKIIDSFTPSKIHLRDPSGLVSVEQRSDEASIVSLKNCSRSNVANTATSSSFYALTQVKCRYQFLCKIREVLALRLVCQAWRRHS